MNYNFLDKAKFDPFDLTDYEELIFKGDSLVHRAAQNLLSEVLRLRSELTDERFQYAGGRIHRFAIVSRNAENDELRQQAVELRKQVADLTAKAADSSWSVDKVSSWWLNATQIEQEEMMRFFARDMAVSEQMKAAAKDFMSESFKK